MLRFKNYLSERDLWLENWIMECEKYIMESPGFDIELERKSGMKSMAAFKRFLGSVSSNYGIEGFNFKSPGKALLFSGVLPGMGQAYLGNWMRALLYVAIDGTAMSTWYYKNNQALEKYY